MSERPIPPWWRERLDTLDDQVDALELEGEPPVPTSWYTDDGEPRIDSQWDDREPD